MVVAGKGGEVPQLESERQAQTYGEEEDRLNNAYRHSHTDEAA